MSRSEVEITAGVPAALAAGRRLVVARGLQLEILPSGRFAVSVSMSRIPQDLDAPGLIVLQKFASPATANDALSALSNEYELEPAELSLLIERLQDAGVLVDADRASAVDEHRLAGGGFAAIGVHHQMLRDLYRVLAYKAAIERNVAGRTVCEIGCGTGILSIFAARAGATRVTAIEESGIASVAERMFERNGVSDRVRLIRANSRDVTLPEPVDVLIHEILGHDPLGESILPVIQDARRRLLKPGGRMIPDRLGLSAIGIELPRALTPPDMLSKQAQDLGHIYGIDVSAYRDELLLESDEAQPRAFNSETLAPLLMSEEAPIVDLDLLDDGDLESFDVTRELVATRDARLDAIVVFFRARLDSQVQLTNSPFAPSTHWGQRALNLPRGTRVRAGDRIPFRVHQGRRLRGGGRAMAVTLV